MSIVVPRGIDQVPLTVVDETAHRTFSARVEHGAYVDQIIYACDHIHVRLPGVKAASEVIVIRKGKPAKWSGRGRLTASR